MKSIVGCLLWLASFPTCATTWEPLPVEEVFENAEIAVVASIVMAEEIDNAGYHCGVKYVAQVEESFKGEKVGRIVFFGYGGPNGMPVGARYVLFLRQGENDMFGAATTNGYSMQRRAKFVEKCGALRKGYQPLSGYGSILQDYSLEVKGEALKVQEAFLVFPDAIVRYRDGFSAVDALYGTVWIKYEDALDYLRSLRP